MNAPAAHPQSAEIIAALPIRQRPGLYLHPKPDAKGNMTVLDRGEDPDDGPVESIVGLALRDELGWYLGCIECDGEIGEEDGGMCRPCREDRAYLEQLRGPGKPDDPRHEDW